MIKRTLFGPVFITKIGDGTFATFATKSSDDDRYIFSNKADYDRCPKSTAKE